MFEFKIMRIFKRYHCRSQAGLPGFPVFSTGWSAGDAVIMGIGFLSGFHGKGEFVFPRRDWAVESVAVSTVGVVAFVEVQQYAPVFNLPDFKVQVTAYIAFSSIGLVCKGKKQVILVFRVIHEFTVSVDIQSAFSSAEPEIGITINEECFLFLRIGWHVKSYCVKDGRKSGGYAIAAVRRKEAEMGTGCRVGNHFMPAHIIFPEKQDTVFVR